jgi:hypothetical protein
MSLLAKEKAKELILECAFAVAEFSEMGVGYSDNELGKPLAKIVVKEVMNTLDKYSIHSDYWKEVELEIERQNY